MIGMTDVETEQPVWSGLRWQRAQMRPADAKMRFEFRARMELRGLARDCPFCGWPVARPSAEYDRLLRAGGEGAYAPGCFDRWHDVAEGVIQDLRHGGEVGAGMGGGATVAGHKGMDRIYRYELRRRWAQNGLTIGWIGANPSVADADRDDPTVRKMIGFSRRWGFAGMVLWNLQAGVATKPADLAKLEDPKGPDNARYLQRAAVAPLVVCCWGDSAPEQLARDVVLSLQQFGAETRSLGWTAKGNPRHPARLAYATELQLSVFDLARMVKA